jgi:hypothetical protein
MKPLNSNNRQACSQITSSNCVRWNGPDIECLNLCYGESVSDVVYKLGVELCALLDALNIANYNDLLQDCPALDVCEPLDFQGLIRFILEKICTVEAIETVQEEQARTLSTLSSGMNALNFIQMADCFQYLNSTGDTVKFSSVTEYVRAIGEKVCLLVAQISIVNNTLSNHSQRIEDLEKEPAPVLEMPQLTPSCVLPSTLVDMDVLLAEVESQFCQLRASTGTSQDIFDNIVLQPNSLNTDNQLCVSSPMSSIADWNPTVTTLAESIGNAWLSIMDIRCAIKNIQLNCCPGGCEDINLSLLVTINSGTMRFYISGTVPSDFEEINPLGTMFTISDTLGNSTTTTFKILDYLNSGYYTLAVGTTPLSIGSDMTIFSQPYLIDNTNNISCQSILSYDVINSVSCPAVTMIPLYTGVSVSFIPTVGSISVSVELWSSDASTLLANNVHVITSPTLTVSSFSGLTNNTNYKIRLAITPTGSTTTTYCTYNSFTTLPLPCSAATGVSSELIV